MSEIHISKTVTYNLSKYIKTLEWKYHENENYWRCLEISDIPCVIKDNGLEVTILTCFQKFMSLLVLLMLKIAIALKNKYFPWNSYCETAKTKNVYRILNGKPSFENANFAGPEIPCGTLTYFNQSLCKYYKFLSSTFKKLWLNKVAVSFWVSKGSSRIRLVDK